MSSASYVTSFRKKRTDAVNIPGTRVSVQNAQLLISTGSHTLDFFLGGGLAIGTLCLIEEDYYNSYGNLLMKYFLAEGVVRGHSIFLAGGEKDPRVFLQELPAAKGIEPSVKVKPDSGELDDNLKIAWRYKEKCMDDTIKVEAYNAGFDLSKKMPSEMIEKCSISTWEPSESNCDESGSFLEVPYSDLYKNIKQDIELKNFKTSSKCTENILRIAVCSIASPLWKRSSDKSYDLGLIRFLYALKALLRTSFAVAVITIPSFLLSNTVLISRMRQICDTAIGLESFVESNKKSNPLFKDFDGLLHIRKLPVLNTFMYPHFTADLAFKLKRKGLIIERLHLPPELGDASPDQQSQLSCSSGLGRKLDF